MMIEYAIETVLGGVKRLIDMFKDYKGVNEEAHEVAMRLERLRKMLQEIPRDEELIREPLEQVEKTVQKSIRIVEERLKKKGGCWAKARDVAASTADRETLIEIGSNIQQAMFDLIAALQVDNTHSIRYLIKLIEDGNDAGEKSERTSKPSCYIRRRKFNNNRSSLDDCFVQRGQILGQMEHWGSLPRPGDDVQKERRVLILQGGPGVGKSQLAAFYFENTKVEYDLKVWLNATSKSELQKGYIDLYKAYLEEYDTALSPLNERDPLENQVAQVYQWINMVGEEKRFLFVYDNAEERPVVEEFFPETDTSHDLVITTRDRVDWSQYKTTVGDVVLDVDVMDPSEAKEYIDKHQENTSDDESAQHLAKRLGYLPRALYNALCYMHKCHLTAATYLQQYERNWKYLLAFSDKEKSTTDSPPPSSVLGTYKMSLDKLKEELPHGATLLSHLSLMASVNIPENVVSFILQRFMCQKSEDTSKVVNDYIRMELEKYGLIRVDSVTRGISLHPLLQTIVRDEQSTMDTLEYWRNCCDAINDKYGSLDNRLLLNHAEMLYNEGDAMCSIKEEKERSKSGSCIAFRGLNKSARARESQLLRNEPWCLGEIYERIGDYKKAQQFYERTLSVKEHVHRKRSRNNPDIALTLNKLGKAMIGTGEYRRAKECFEKALHIYQKTLTKNNVKVDESKELLARSLLQVGDAPNAKAYLEDVLSSRRQHEHSNGSNRPNNTVESASTLRFLGTALYELGDSRKAKEYYEQALKCVGPTPVEVSKTKEDLGDVECDLGDAKSSKQFYEQALAIKEEYYGPEHVEVATTRMKLGTAEANLGDAKRAKEYYEDALRIHTEYYGSAHVEVAETLEKLGNVLAELGEFECAKQRLEQALPVKKEFYGPTHVKVSETLMNLGTVLADLGKFKDAKQHLEDSLKIKKEYYGPTHVRIAETLENLGTVLADLGHYEDARKRLKDVLQIKEEFYGHKHVASASTLINLGSVLANLGDASGAKNCYEKALDIHTEYYGRRQKETATTLMHLGTAMADLGYFDKAKECYEEVLPIREESFGPEHAEVANTLENLGTALANLCDAKGGKQLIEKALSMKEKFYDFKNFEVAKTLERLGAVLPKLGDSTGAKQRFEEALEIKKKHFGPEHSEVAKTLMNLGNIFADLGNFNRAKQCYEECLAIRKVVHGLQQHAEVARTQKALGFALSQLGNVEGAKENENEALSIENEIYGPNHE